MEYYENVSDSFWVVDSAYNISGLVRYSQQTLDGVNMSLLNYVDESVIQNTTSVVGYYEFNDLYPGNYWVRAYLTGGYVSVFVPFMDDFLDKAAVCEQSFGGELEIEAILGDSSYLVLMNPLSAKPSMIDIYTHWKVDELTSKMEPVHPVSMT